MASAAALSIALAFGAPGVANADPPKPSPIMTCPGGQYRVYNKDQCPPYPRNPVSITPPSRGGGGPGGGGLIGTIGRILGGLTGGLL